MMVSVKIELKQTEIHIVCVISANFFLENLYLAGIVLFFAWKLQLVKAQAWKINDIFLSGTNSNKKTAYSRHIFGKTVIALILLIQE